MQIYNTTLGSRQMSYIEDDHVFDIKALERVAVSFTDFLFTKFILLTTGQERRDKRVMGTTQLVGKYRRHGRMLILHIATSHSSGSFKQIISTKRG